MYTIQQKPKQKCECRFNRTIRNIFSESCGEIIAIRRQTCYINFNYEENEKFVNVFRVAGRKLYVGVYQRETEVSVRYISIFVGERTYIIIFMKMITYDVEKGRRKFSSRYQCVCACGYQLLSKLTIKISIVIRFD